MMWWCCVFIGRLFYEVNEADSWQVIPFYKGVAGTGKSTIIKVVEMCYQHRDIGVLSNNVEKQFGLSMIADKLIFVAPEIKGEFSLDQAQFQSMITGEKVSMSVKGRTALQKHWTIPGILAGNESVRWADKSGSISRRIVVFPFNYQIPANSSNPFLLQDIERNEVPSIIRKCAIAYKEAIRLYRRSDIWHVLPREIQVEKDKLQYSSNPLYAFLASEYVIFGEDTPYCRQSDFIQKLRNFTKQTFGNSESFKFNQDFYQSTFDKHNITVAHEERLWPILGGIPVLQTYILGCVLSTKEI
jgi:phage/plasmid-associated DNA primase